MTFPAFTALFHNDLWSKSMRTKTLMIVGTAVIILAGAAAMAHSRGGPGGGERGAIFFERFDIDGDGSVTAVEFKEAREGYRERYDADGDGALNIEEFEALITAEMVRQRAQRQFGRLDADGDGLITTEEADLAAERMLERIDANGDGVVTQDELRDRRGKGPGHGDRG